MVHYCICFLPKRWDARMGRQPLSDCPASLPSQLPCLNPHSKVPLPRLLAPLLLAQSTPLHKLYLLCVSLLGYRSRPLQIPPPPFPISPTPQPLLGELYPAGIIRGALYQPPAPGIAVCRPPLPPPDALKRRHNALCGFPPATAFLFSSGQRSRCHLITPFLKTCSTFA